MVYVFFKLNGLIKEYMNEYLVIFEKKEDDWYMYMIRYLISFDWLDNFSKEIKNF